MSRLLLIAGMLAAVAGAGCHRQPPTGGATNSKAEQARKQAESLALSVVNSVASAYPQASPEPAKKSGVGVVASKVAASVVGVGVAQVSVERAAGSPQPPPPPRSPATTQVILRPGSPPAIKERVVNALPAANEADAEEDTLLVAQDTIEQRLAEMDPPVTYRPSANEVKNEFLRRNSRTVRAASPEERAELARHGIDPNRVYVEYEIEMSADQVRGLRTQNRLTEALQILPVVIGVLVLGFGFLRLDEWTKGNMTRWLAIAAGLVGGGAAAVWYFLSS